MNGKSRLLAVLLTMLLASSAFGMLSVMATVGGTLGILYPTHVAAGGPMRLDGTGFTATGGTTYLYLSKDDGPVISATDVYVGSLKSVDLINEQPIFWLPSNVNAGEYYLKAADLKQVAYACVVSADQINIVSTFPTVTLSDATGNVEDVVTVEGVGADDFDDVTVTWGDFDTDPVAGVIADGEFEVDYEIPHIYKGSYKIFVLLENADGDSFATFVTFGVEPALALTPAALSIPANQLGVDLTMAGTGFPKGDVEADTVKVQLKDFMTGATLETFDAIHALAEVSEVDPTKGDLTVAFTLDDVDAGIGNVIVTIGTQTFTFNDAFYVSAPPATFTSITHWKISKIEGQNGGKVTFTFINLPGLADVRVDFIGTTVTKQTPVGLSDANGAFKYTYTINEMPGDLYTVRAYVTSGATIRERTFPSGFKVLPKLTIAQKEAFVGDLIDITGTGYPADAVFTGVKFGAADVVDIDINVLATGEFEIIDFPVPNVSGGGMSITVVISGEDANGVDISTQGTIKIKPKVTALSSIAQDGTWVVPGTVYPGHIMKIVGTGFLAGEAIAVKMYDGNDNLVGAAVVGDGEKAKANGGLTLIAWLPNAKVLYPAGKLGCYLTAAGATASNKANSADFDVTASADATAWIFAGIKNNGGFKLEYNVGDTLRVVGLGFRTATQAIKIDDGDTLKSVTAVNGFFGTSITLPNLEKDDYTIRLLSNVWSIIPKIVLSPGSGFEDTKFTVTGTGFVAEDTTIWWQGLLGDEDLATVDADDVDDGHFAVEVTVPVVVPMSYRVSAVGATAEDAAVFTVLDEAAANTTKTLKELGIKIGALAVSGDATKKSADAATAAANAATAAATASSTAAAAASNKADAAAAAATAAGTKADAAKAAADAAAAAATSTGNAAAAAANAAGTKADAAKAAADAAKAAAGAAKAAADAAKASAESLTTLVYGAIGAALVAAVAAIIGVMLINKSIKG